MDLTGGNVVPPYPHPPLLLFWGILKNKKSFFIKLQIRIRITKKVL
jgi:hypothetical protein